MQPHPHPRPPHRALLQSSDIFHTSKFTPARLAPGARLKIPVVFLARVVGSPEAYLAIQTSAGGFLYPLRALAVPNPYGLTAIAATVPTREAYAPTLTLRNPHTSPLVVKEVYSSEEFLQLDLPAGAAAAPGADAAAAAAAREKLWHLGADEAKEVVRVNFTAAVAGKYVGYVHLNTDVASMIVPVEITAVDGGVHRHPQALHFGVLSQPTELTTLPLTLSSTLDVPLLLKEMCAPRPPPPRPPRPPRRRRR